MKKNKFALQITAFSLIVIAFVGCDKDFATLESDIINEDNATNFDIDSQRYDIITSTKALGPVQTNGLGLNSLGIYDDIYGRTTSSFVTQLSLSTFDPSFGEEVEIDSVVLTIPYFATVTDVDDDGNFTYELDSVFGNNPINLKIFESNYFIRDFDPNGEFSDTQAYFSNKSASESEQISEAVLEGVELGFIEYNDQGEIVAIDNIIEINNEGYILTEEDNDDEDTEPQVTQRLSPGLRVHLDPTFWQNKILDQEGETVLGSQNNFSEYFRGLYFKAETVDDDGSFLILNAGAQNSNITIYYSSLTTSTSDEANATEQNTLVLNFSPNRINFFENNFNNIPLNDGDDINGDARLYLKGGEGALAKIQLFNGENPDDVPELNAFEIFKNSFVETDADGNFVSPKRLVNEANLVFYVDQEIVNGQGSANGSEPDRIYLYDAENNTPLIDYFLDATNNSLPEFSKFSHLGPLQRVDDEPNGNGIKYKLKVTEHINNLLLRDSTNVELGLAVSLNVNLEEQFNQRQVQDGDNSDLRVPVSSVITPRGTVLHGNNTEDESKRVYLEIYYTEPNN